MASEVRAVAGRVALVEEQVEDMEDGSQSLRAFRRRGKRERLGGRLHLGLRPTDPLRHRRLGDEERRGDLAGREPAHRAQRQRDGRRRSERGVTAHEHEHERVVLTGRRIRRRDRPRRGEVFAAASGVVAPVVLDHAPGRDADQPGDRLVRGPVGGPGRCRREEHFLNRVLGIGEVAVTAEHDTEDPRRQLAQQVLDARRVRHISGSGALRV